MRRPVILTALIAIGSATLFASNAVAGGWLTGCGGCGAPAYPAGNVVYAAPVYSYAPPTYTIIPHYVVQPNYVVQRTYVIRQTRYLNEPAAPCLFGCGAGYVANQGQYYSGPGPVAPAVSFEREPYYAPAVYPRHDRYYAPARPRYYHRRVYQGNVYRHPRPYAVTSYRVNRHPPRHVNQQTRYR